ncbi:MAG TPA: PH domain-containing protein [Stellaceae bacterium]|nr:PH domain-containing protein [Stellaceae bacterium]
MSYVSRVLQPGETVVYATTLHWLIYLRAIVLLIVAIGLAIASQWATGNGNLALLIAAALFGLLAISSGVRAWLRRVTTELAVTDLRVIYKAGLLGRHTLEMNRSKVESVDVDQSLLGRIFGYGTIIVRGTGGSLEPMRNIRNPIDFRSHITAR